MRNKLITRLCPIAPAIIIFLHLPLILVAQSDSVPNPGQFLFREFSRAVVAMKTGQDQTLIMNYDIISGKMVFRQKGKIYELMSPVSVDTVYIRNTRFVPVGKVFYELISEVPVTLFVQYKGLVQAPVKTDPYGRVSESVSTSSVYNIKVGSEFFVLNDPDVIIESKMIYWLQSDKSVQSFTDANQFVKIFPGLKKEAKDFIRQKNIRFDNTGDVIELVSFCCGK